MQRNIRTKSRPKLTHSSSSARYAHINWNNCGVVIFTDICKHCKSKQITSHNSIHQTQNHLRETTNYCLNQAGPWKTSGRKPVYIYCDEWMTSVDQRVSEPRTRSHGLNYPHQPSLHTQCIYTLTHITVMHGLWASCSHTRHTVVAKGGDALWLG